MSKPLTDTRRKRSAVRPKLDRGLQALAFGEAATVTEAAKICGMTREAFHRALNRPEVEERYLSYIRQRAKTLGARTAVETLTYLAEKASADELRAVTAKDLLSLAGVPVESAALQAGAAQLPNGGTQLVINVVSHHPESGLSRAIPVQAAPIESESSQIEGPAGPVSPPAKGGETGE